MSKRPAAKPLTTKPRLRQRQLPTIKAQAQSQHLAELRAGVRYNKTVSRLARQLQRAIVQAEDAGVALWAFLDRSASVNEEKTKRAKLYDAPETVRDATTGEELQVERV